MIHMYDACIYDPTLDSDACIHDAHICDPGPGDVCMVHVNMMRYFLVTDGRTRRVGWHALWQQELLSELIIIEPFLDCDQNMILMGFMWKS